MENNKIVIPFLAGAEIDNKLYFSSYYVNGLFCYDFNLEKCEYICPFEDEINAVCLYRKAFIYEKDIWFMPMEAKKVAMYNTTEKKMFYFDIGKDEKCTWQDGFYEWFKCDNNIFFVPYKVGNPLYSVDVLTRSVMKVSDTIGLPDLAIVGASANRGDLMITLQDGRVFCGKNGGWNEIVEVGNSNKSIIEYYSTVDDGQNLWIIPFEERKLIAINKEKRVKVIKMEFDAPGKYAHGCAKDNHIVLFPADTNRTISVLKAEDNIVVEEKKISLKCNNNEWIEIAEIESDREDCYLLSSSDGIIYEFDDKWNLRKNFTISMSEKEYHDYIGNVASSEMISRAQSLFETEFLDLDIFVKSVIN